MFEGGAKASIPTDVNRDALIKAHRLDANRQIAIDGTWLALRLTAAE